jgi:hypothetical protein
MVWLGFEKYHFILLAMEHYAKAAGVLRWETENI